MKTTKGALLLDGWSCSGTHYIGVIASYCSRQEGGTEIQPRQSVIAVPPIPTVDNESGVVVSDHENAEFNAETHHTFLKDILNSYGINFQYLVICLICDNASVNRKLARTCTKPAIGCNSHKFNLQMKQMLSNYTELENVIDEVQMTMKSAHTLKKSTLLRNLTDYRAILPSETRWSGARGMLERYLKIHDELNEVKENNHSDLQMNQNMKFKQKVEPYAYMLAELDQFTVTLETENHTLADCRSDLGTLITTLREHRAAKGSPLFRL